MFRLVFADAMESSFRGDSTRRAYRAYIICLGVVILLSWPVDRISYIVHFSTRPGTFTFALFFSLAFSLFFSLQSANITTPRVWLRFGGASAPGIILGVLLFSILHLLVITALALPLALAAVAVTGYGGVALIRAYLIIALFCFMIRMSANVLRVLVSDRGCLRSIVMFGIVLFFLLFSARPFPNLNPIVALLGVIDNGNVSLISGEIIRAPLEHSSIRAFAIGSVLATLLYTGSVALLSAGIRGTSDGTNRS